MKKSHISFFVIIMMSISRSLSAQSFDEQMDRFITSSENGFEAIKGEALEDKEGFGLFVCMLELDGFEISLVDMDPGLMVYGEAIDLNKANLNLAMMRMLPPAGFTASDSDEGAVMDMPEGAVRQVTYTSRNKVTIINTVYFDDATISLTITGN